MKKSVLLLATVSLTMLVVCGTVGADTFAVTNTVDSGPGSLRTAIVKANENPGRDVITFSPGARGEIRLRSALPGMRGEAEIRGPGSGRLTVRRVVPREFRIFTTATGSKVTISGLTVSNGRSPVGAGIRNSGDLTLRNTTFSENSATFGGGVHSGFSTDLTVVGSTFSGNEALNGGGVYTEVSLKVTTSSFSGNKAEANGGGIFGGEVSDVRVARSIFSGNRARDGAGIFTRSERNLTVEDSTFSRNFSFEDGVLVGIGGAIADSDGDGTTTVEGSTFSENRAGNGAGISGNTLTIRNSTFSGNEARYSGGGIDVGGGTQTVTGSTFSGNSAQNGGGIFRSYYSDLLTIRNSTLSGNEARAAGGGIYSQYTELDGGKLAVEASTIAGNTAAVAGGGLRQDNDEGNPSAAAAAFTLRMTLVAGNAAPEGPDASGPLRSRGYNLIRDPSGATGFGPTDLTNTRAGLDPQGLTDNGGPTRTISLLPDSPALDAVEAGCSPPTTDQRGVSRPQNGDGSGNALCDIGAFERQASP